MSFFVDPIHGRIEIPTWLSRILNNSLVRRTMFIRQLGLKAYIDFPGAIHTRFSHLIGSMHLAGKLCDILINKLSELKEGKEVRDILNNQRTTIMVAGFLHDIGHGPFSHAIDYALKRVLGQSHEELTSKLILNKFNELEPHTDLKKIASIVKGKYEFPFITKIINGPMDVDRLDFLIRDSYHVGLKYYFDVEYFIHKYAIIGIESEEDLKKLTLGLSNDKTAITTAEIFFVIWRGMYELVYFKDRSRVAEKMLEYAVLNKVQVDPDFKSLFEDINKFSELDDDLLLRKLEEGNQVCSEIARRIRMGELYELILKKDIKDILESITTKAEFINQLKTDPDNISYKLSEMINNELGYPFDNIPPVICDIIPSKIIKEEIKLSQPYKETGEPYDLKDVSDILSHLPSKFELRIYVDERKVRDIHKENNFKKIKEGVEKIIKEW